MVQWIDFPRSTCSFSLRFPRNKQLLANRYPCATLVTISIFLAVDRCLLRTTMRFQLGQTLATLLVTGWMLAVSHGFSWNQLSQQQGLYIGDTNNRNILSQKDVTKMTTRRETIRMPNQTPMVPWRVCTMHLLRS